MDIFLKSTRDRLKNIIGETNIQDDKDIDTLLRFYLSQLVSVYYINKDTDYQIYKNISNEYYNGKITICNSFPDKLDELKKDM